MPVAKKAKRKPRKPALRAAPIQDRAVQTRDRLLDELRISLRRAA